jgi:nucleoside-diphosphate-sugar epimerase
MSFLVFGGEKGWIGQKIVAMLKEAGHEVHVAKSRLEDRNHIEQELDQIKPKYIMNCAGVTGRPNVDWCEDHKIETIRSNVIGTLTLCDVAYLRGIHVTNFATGCIYEYDDKHTMANNVGFVEEDTHNFTASFYSNTKATVEKLLQHYPNVLTLRLRMPISEDLNPRSFITKITKYEKVVNIPNSMTILPELLPISIKMTLDELKGVYNFTNPGAISHNEILEMYKKYVDPSFTWKNFTIEEQNQILKAKRSNNTLDVSKLVKYVPNIKPVRESLETFVLPRMAELQKRQQ